LDIEHSLRWHDPGRFNGYVLSQHLAGTPVDAVNLRDALMAVKERTVSAALGLFRLVRWPGRAQRPKTAVSLAGRHHLISIGTDGTSPDLKHDDSVEVEMTGIGTLRNPFVAAA
jgi:2-keto-4-pentenoate hydratase/2-oxohepta-3-ene-1,7-dioic acid hydratase in catechol pathway